MSIDADGLSNRHDLILKMILKDSRLCELHSQSNVPLQNRDVNKNLVYLYFKIVEVLRNSEHLDLAVCQNVSINEHPAGEVQNKEHVLPGEHKIQSGIQCVRLTS